MRDDEFLFARMERESYVINGSGYWSLHLVVLTKVSSCSTQIPLALLPLFCLFLFSLVFSLSALIFLYCCSNSEMALSKTWVYKNGLSSHSHWVLSCIGIVIHIFELVELLEFLFHCYSLVMEESGLFKRIVPWIGVIINQSFHFKVPLSLAFYLCVCLQHVVFRVVLLFVTLWKFLPLGIRTLYHSMWWLFSFLLQAIEVGFRFCWSNDCHCKTILQTKCFFSNLSLFQGIIFYLVPWISNHCRVECYERRE